MDVSWRSRKQPTWNDCASLGVVPQQNMFSHATPGLSQPLHPLGYLRAAATSSWARSNRKQPSA